ncbi:MAG: ACP S-malonyltransferase [Alphaproteobacteria bacterium]
MKYALVFPGQGSQAVGMGKILAENFSEAQDVFREVDDTLSQKLSTLMFEGPLEDLTLTTNCQPALMAVSMAVFRVMTSLGVPLTVFSYAAGHSLGEYSALAATGALTLADTTRLLRTRGDAMQKAIPLGHGAMTAVIGADDGALNNIVKDCSAFGVCEIANDNAPGQVILSGEKKALDQVSPLAEKYGVRKIIPLNVSAPFHCSLMKPAALAMEEALNEVSINYPGIPILPNVTARPETKPDILKSLLVMQITGRVRWRETVLHMQEMGVTHIIEAGSGKVLAGLIKRITPDIQVQSVHTPEEIDNCIKTMERGI